MLHLNIHEIKTHLSNYLGKVARGETVIICKRNVPIAELKPMKKRLKRKRPIGLAGKLYPDFKVDDSFFEPLPDDVLAGFYGGKP